MSNNNIPTGLTSAEVEARKLKGQINDFKINSSKSNWQIFQENAFTLFNAVNFFIAFCLIAVGSYTNVLFIFFIMYNIVAGIVVEIRARNVIDKLNIINRTLTTVIRDGEIAHINPEGIVLGDILKLKTGDQVPSDSVLLDGYVEVNESLLTGESDMIEKKKDSKLLSGSYISSGQCYAQVKHVGADNYSVKLAIEAKTHKPIVSQLLDSMRRLTKFTSRIVIPLGLLLFIEAFILRQDGIQDSVVSTSAAILGMLPKGIMVLIVIALITAILKLGRRKILVQEMYSVETMAHIDILCLDKTGTLTEGHMKVSAVNIIDQSFSKAKITQILGSYVKSSVDNSSTMKALREHYPENDKFKTKSSVPFSSDRKWSSIEIKGIGHIILGAPEIIFNEVPAEITKQQNKGTRVLGVGISTQKTLTAKTELKDIQQIAVIELKDTIRKDAEKTLKYLSKQGIDIKIISGDNAHTVSKIAERAGFEKFDEFLDVTDMPDDELRRQAPITSIFGRVSPRQKKLIIEELKKHDHTVGMIGDGVNDILALRESDLSIAMAEGDAAAKQVSNLVLLESSFSELPNVLFEGRRIVNNSSRVSSIFFIKTIYTFLLATLCALSVFTNSIIIFPFISIQITFLDQIIEGFPSFFMSFEQDKNRIEKHFLKKSLLRALPNALLITFSVALVYLIGSINGWSQIESSTLMYYLLGTITLMGVARACIPFNKLRLFLLSTSTIGFFGTSFIFQSLLQIETLTANTLPIFIILSLASLIILSFIYRATTRQHPSKA
jgi:cation-transporting ATPase E